ncbi:YesL family protein [Fredinandcohnia humi]
MNSISSTIYSLLEWITRFAFIQLLWILFTLAGGIILGFFPSTIAMFAIVRSWIRGNSDIPIFTSFVNFYKSEFIKSNKLGIVIMVVVAFVGLDLYYIQQNANTYLSWTSIPLFAFMALFVLFLFYLFPAFVHYDLNNISIFKNAFLIMLINPINTFFIVFSLASLFAIMCLFPALAFIFGASSYAFITMWFSLYAFNKAHKA